MRGRHGAAKRDRLIPFKRKVTEENAAGEPETVSLELIGRTWAAVSYGTATERRTAGIEGNDLPATFNTLQNPMTRSIGPGHFIEYDGGIWDITSTAPFGRDEIDFNAVRRASLNTGA